MKTRMFLMGILIGVLILSACQQEAKTAATQPPVQDMMEDGIPAPPDAPGAESGMPTGGEEGTEEMMVQGDDEGEEIMEVDLIAKKFEFSPDTITVEQGVKVVINAKSIDVAHGFSLPDFNINERLEPNQEVRIEFVADKKGTFSFFCSVPCGSGHGSMRGKLIVQ